MMQASAYDILVRPMAENYPVVLSSFLCCCILQYMSGVVSAKHFPKVFSRLTEAEKLDWCVRVVSSTHAIISWGTIYGFLFPVPELAGVVGATGVTSYNHYAYSSEAQWYFSVSCGYFLWDIIASIYYSWGAMFIVHAFASFGVFYFSLFPFLHLWGRYFLGVFELSSVFLHLRGILSLAKKDDGLLFKVVEGLFALSFTIVRVILGAYVSYYWWKEMVALIVNNTAHSKAVVIYYLAANAILMSLQAMWFVMLVRGALGLDAPAKQDVKKDQ